MYRFISSCIITVFIIATSLYPNGLSLNSIGPRALGMGGAFIGIADDYSAVYWNPAGISQIKDPLIAAYFTGVMPTATYKLTMAGQTIADATSEAELFPVPGVMGYFPIIAGTLNAGIGVYIPSGIGVTWNGDDMKYLSGGRSMKWHSRVGVVAISPALSFDLLSTLSIGAALNLSYGMFDMDRPTSAGPLYGQYSESSTGFGYGGTIGVLFKPVQDLSIGVTFRTKNSISFKGTASNELIKAVMSTNYEDADLSRDIVWPMWIGGGIAYHPFTGFTVALDAQWSQWSATQDSIETTYTGWSPILTKNQLILKWKDALQLRLGFEYELMKTLAIRAGFYTDPAPSPDETLNVLFPSISYNVATIGASFSLGTIRIDAALEYLMGQERDVTQTADTSEGGMPGIHNNNIFGFSVGLAFGL